PCPARFRFVRNPGPFYRFRGRRVAQTAIPVRRGVRVTFDTPVRTSSSRCWQIILLRLALFSAAVYPHAGSGQAVIGRSLSSRFVSSEVRMLGTLSALVGLVGFLGVAPAEATPPRYRIEVVVHQGPRKAGGSSIVSRPTMFLMADQPGYVSVGQEALLWGR